MNGEVLLITLIPLILFVVVEVFLGLKAGIWTAIGTAIAGLVYFSLRVGTLDSMLVAEVVLIAALGLISLKMMNDRFFKFQPVLMSAALCLYVAYGQWSGQPVLLKLMELIDRLEPQLAAVYDSEPGRQWLTSMSGDLIYLFIAHGLLVWWGAMKLKSFGWLMTRLAFYPMAIAFMAYEVVTSGHPFTNL